MVVKKGFLIGLISYAVVAGAAFAGCEFPYYPEYANVFSKYDEVSPLLAKKVPIAIRSEFSPTGAIVCEPLRIRDIVGMPLRYVVPTYDGDDLELVRKWNDLAGKLNGGERMPASAFGERVSSFFDSKEVVNFSTAAVMPYKFQGIAPNGENAFPPVFSGYGAAYDLARKELKADDLTFVRIVGGSLTGEQSFEFEGGSGEAIIVRYSPSGDVSIVDPEQERKQTRAKADAVCRSIVGLELSGQIYRNIKRWDDVDAAIPDEVAAEEFAVTIEHEFPKEEEYPPEYEELFGRFRAITPEEAMMLVSARGAPPGKGWVGKPILEPIIIRTFEGDVYNYWLLSYKGKEPHVLAAAEDAIAMLNAEDGFDPYEFIEAWAAVEDHAREFGLFIVDGWTWGDGIKLLGGSPSGLLYDFKSYLYFAETLYGEGNILKMKRLVTGIQPYGWLYAFDVRGSGKKYIYDYPDGSEGGINRWEIDEDGIREVALGRMARLYNHYSTTPEYYDEAEANWTETLEYIKANAVKKDGYYRLQNCWEEE